ncbi:MAG TPA: hypothetical protein VMU78_06970, partial [Methylocella sp.]|nr:hypothetical protein [Methylocella sp.]
MTFAFPISFDSHWIIRESYGRAAGAFSHAIAKGLIVHKVLRFVFLASGKCNLILNVHDIAYQEA